MLLHLPIVSWMPGGTSWQPGTGIVIAFVMYVLPGQFDGLISCKQRLSWIKITAKEGLGAVGVEPSMLGEAKQAMGSLACAQ